MRIAVIGGMQRLEREYLQVGQKLGIALRIFNQAGSQMRKRLGQSEALVLFTDKMSHQIRTEAMEVARTRGIPVYMLHSCGVCTLRNCLNCLKSKEVFVN